ncbi:toprim domain-containing protein [Saccharothrix sp. ST-888]|uniref:toprim domain-containing protein n=1 Tax=Saccharothrix sp. ST-888 TaxID=1427391 RepID=UPI0005ECB25A|nr:toprim domain-containing protein [Saccharothrix sp. ST-888]KJK56214.1 hypothetical protein UK12_23805 [Saccharothrix sp. ST-888]
MNSGGWDLLAAYSNPVPADVPQALQRLGVEPLRETADEVNARCPMHLALTGKADRNPSFWVNTRTGRYICFSCRYSGVFVQLVADVLDTDRESAVRWIAKQGLYRLHADEEDQAPARPDVSVTEASLALFSHPPPQALAERKLTADACAAYGVLWDPAAEHWIIPIRHPETGVLLGWQEKGYRYFRNYPDGVVKSATLFGYHTPYGDFSILLESPLDAVRLASLGIPGAVAAYGAYVSAAQMQLLRRRSGVLVLALDNDVTGLRSRDSLYRTWRPRGLRMKYANYQGISAKDVGEMTDSDARRAIETAYLPIRRKGRI